MDRSLCVRDCGVALVVERRISGADEKSVSNVRSRRLTMLALKVDGRVGVYMVESVWLICQK